MTVEEIKRRSMTAYPLTAVAKAFGLSPGWLRKHVRAGTLRRELRGCPNAKRQTYYLRPLDVDELLKGGSSNRHRQTPVVSSMRPIGRRGRSVDMKDVPRRF